MSPHKKRRKRNRRARGESERNGEMFRAVFERANVGISMRTADGSRWLRVNDRLCEILGYTREELLASPAAAMSTMEDREIAESVLGRIQRGEITSVTREKPYLRKDGGTVWTTQSTTVITDAHGKPEYLLSVHEDISERKRAAAALRQSEQHFRAVFQKANVGIALRSLDGRWLSVNDKLCELLGYTRLELLALTSVDVTPPEDRSETHEYIRRMAGGEIASSYSRHDEKVRGIRSWPCNCQGTGRSHGRRDLGGERAGTRFDVRLYGPDKGHRRVRTIPADRDTDRASGVDCR